MESEPREQNMEQDFSGSASDPQILTEPRHATTRLKFDEGARGIKLAIRSESGFFAHAYRGLLIAICAVILGVSSTGWCFLIVSAALVLVAETFRCAILATLDLLVEPGDPRVRNAREIASGGLLFASITSGCLTVMVLSAKLSEMLGW
ncbi:diacylglycerol kinase family protein [Tautonia rosea]|uniref:diacylglycerol kinase family protein n=1 Tax=Tautonia rosea TaxID=2728037 RepID=UPI00147382F3|nr:diacylglycerol kinase family protein [Tautonia rosea]